jgi:hypothetical protein
MPKQSVLIQIGVTLVVMFAAFYIWDRTVDKFAGAAFKPGFNKNVRTMCDNSGCYPIN